MWFCFTAISGAKTLGKALISLVDSLIAFFKYLRKLNVQKLMDDFIAWFIKLFKTTKELAVEALNKFSIAKRRIKKAGYAPTKVVDDFVVICPIK